MKFMTTKLALALYGAALLTLAGCGGSNSVASLPPAITSTTTLAGTAATGAAFTDAIVTVTDSRGITVGTGLVGADGTFNITLATGAVAPYVLTATRTSADGAVESLVSVVPTGSSPTATATVNISPVTNLIASRLSSSGDPLQLAAELAAKTSTIDVASVAAKVLEVQTILAPILTATDTTNTDPLTGVFATNGAGYDRLLDSIRVTITPSSSTSTNIEVGIKQQLADGVAPTAIQFTSSTALASVPVIPAITSSTLVAPGTAQLIAAHLAQLNACFALPVASRISTGGTVAADITAAECKNAFVGNNPANYLSNGKVVGVGQAFNGMFVSGGDGVVFSQGAYEFTRSNGDIVASYKSKDALGNETFDTFAVRLDTDGKLKQIGNQYVYGGGVNSYHQLRDFVNQPASTYYSTGYTINIPLIAGVAYVNIKTPKGNVLTLIRGSDGMVFPKLNVNRQPIDNANAANVAATPGNMVASGTNYLRIRSEYADVASIAAHPATRESGLFFSPADASDAEISTYGNQSVWEFTYFDNTGAQQGLAQNYKTRTRARTVSEMRTQKWANLSAADLTALTASFVSNGTGGGSTSLPASANVAPTWEVTPGALPPTQIKLFGNTRIPVTPLASPITYVQVTPATTPSTFIKTSFNDGYTVGSTVRTATIPCANGNSELHCSIANPAGYQGFATMTGLHLWARDIAGSEFVRFYATYILP